MADSIQSVALGAGSVFELSLRNAAGATQKFELPIEQIPTLVEQLSAVAWASAASNRPPAGTVLPEVHAFPVRRSEAGYTGDNKEPVLLVELFGGVKIGLHFTPDAARTVASDLGRLAASAPTLKR